MRTDLGYGSEEFFSIKEVGTVAGVARRRVREQIAAGQIVTVYGLVRAGDAIQLVRELAGASTAPADRSPLTPLTPSRGRRAVPLVLSASVHGLLLALLITGFGLGLLTPADPDPAQVPIEPVRLVYLMAVGPGGGGGGGLHLPVPPPPEPQPKADTPIRTTKTPAPVIRRPVPPPPRPVRTLAIARAESQRRYVPPPPAPPAVHAPVLQTASPKPDPAGIQSLPPSKTAGTGSGEGEGAGLGAGTGGGTGGGPFRPGSGIDPPSLLSEVRPTYTDEARRRAVEGDVVLEIVVLRDGRVGNVSVVRRLGAGLDDRAVQAVRQWRFAPARRHGTPVDVVVEVSVGFKLR